MYDVEQINRLIRSRRTVKPADMDGQRTIARPVVDSLLENANWAPNHGKTEPWRFRVYAGAAREQLADTLVRLYEATTPADERRADKLDKLANNPGRASHAIAVFMQRHGGGPATKIPEVEEVEAVACAVQNLQLSAHAHGIGAFWSTGPMTYQEEAVARVFELDASWRYLGILYLGYPRGTKGTGKPNDPLRPGLRNPIADKTEWIEP